MNIDYLIEYLENIFLKKLYTKCGGETILNSVCKNAKFSISLDPYIKF